MRSAGGRQRPEHAVEGTRVHARTPEEVGGGRANLHDDDTGRQVVPALEKAGRGLRCLAGELTCFAAVASATQLAAEGANRSREQYYGGGHLRRCAWPADGGGVDLTREHTGVAYRVVDLVQGVLVATQAWSDTAL